MGRDRRGRHRKGAELRSLPVPSRRARCLDLLRRIVPSRGKSREPPVAPDSGLPLARGDLIRYPRVQAPAPPRKEGERMICSFRHRERSGLPSKGLNLEGANRALKIPVTRDQRCLPRLGHSAGEAVGVGEIVL
jgi:hypothetical protein